VKAAFEDDDLVGGRVLLKDHLERVLVCDRSRERKPNMLHVFARVSEQCARNTKLFRPRHQVTLKNRITCCRDDRGFEQVRVVVTEGIDSDAANEVELHRAVCHPDSSTLACARREHGHHERATPHPFEFPNALFVGLRAEGTIRRFVLNRRDKCAYGFGCYQRIDRRQRFLSSHVPGFIGEHSFGLARVREPQHLLADFPWTCRLMKPRCARWSWDNHLSSDSAV
jgi:hypothetical protein